MYLSTALILGVLYLLPHHYILSQTPPSPSFSSLHNVTCVYSPVPPSTPFQFFFCFYPVILGAILYPCLSGLWPLNLFLMARMGGFGWLVNLAIHITFVSIVLFVPREAMILNSPLPCPDPEWKPWRPSLSYGWIGFYYAVLVALMVGVWKTHWFVRLSRRTKKKNGWKSSGFASDPWEGCDKEAFIL